MVIVIEKEGVLLMSYNNQLQELQEKILQKKSLEAKLKELQSQREQLDERVQEMQQIMQREQEDVERLERTSLASVFYSIVGKKDEVLDKEKMEAYTAKVKYDSSVQERNRVEEDRKRLEAQLRGISGLERQYEKLLEERITSIKRSNSEEAKRIFEIEKQIAELRNQEKEIKEAISAGSCALNTANSVLDSLNSAKGWGTWDLVGGGLVSDVIKHDHLDKAQNKIQQLQRELSRFKTELADVTIQSDIQIGIEGFLRFADYFFDGLFVDWLVLDKISESKSSVESTKSQIESVLNRLRDMEASNDQTVKTLESEKDSIVVNGNCC